MLNFSYMCIDRTTHESNSNIDTRNIYCFAKEWGAWGEEGPMRTHEGTAANEADPPNYFKHDAPLAERFGGRLKIRPTS